jgi:hypothetical protein
LRQPDLTVWFSLDPAIASNHSPKTSLPLFIAATPSALA